MTNNSDPKEKSSSAIRALNILETVASAPTPLTATEINHTLKLPKPTIHRLCLMLEQEGYLQPHLDGRGYLPGNRMSKMAIGVFCNNDHLRTERHAILQRLSTEVGETCNICIPDGVDMVYFDRVETHWPLRVHMQINDRVPSYCTASGKLFLSSLPNAKRNRLISKLKFVRYTPNTITDVDELKAELKRIRRDNIGVDNEEFLQGMVAVAVPLKNTIGQIYGALAMHAPSARMNMEKALEHLPKMKIAAEELMELVDY